MRILLYFLVIAFLGLLATLASAQSSGDLILQYKGSSGASLQYLTPSTGTGIPAFNGASPNRIELLPRSTFATPADVAAYAQPLDSDLTTLAGVTSTATGRNLLSSSSATAAKTVLGMGPTGGLICLGLQVIQSPTELVPGFFAFIDATQTHVVKVGANAAPTSSFTIDLPTAAGEWLTSGSSLNASNIISGSLALARIAQGGATVGQALAWNGTEYAPTTFTNAVTSVAGRTGAITLSTSDISGLGTIASQAANSVAITGGGVTGISTLGVAKGALTTSSPITISETWNASGVVFGGLTHAITNTASASGSKAWSIESPPGTAQISVARNSVTGNDASNWRLVIGSSASIGWAAAYGALTIRNEANTADVNLKVAGLDATYVAATNFISIGAEGAVEMSSASWRGAGLRLAKDSSITWTTTTAAAGADGIKITQGTASPEGSLTAKPGSTYQRDNAGTGELWIKSTGTGNTGWVKIY